MNNKENERQLELPGMPPNPPKRDTVASIEGNQALLLIGKVATQVCFKKQLLVLALEVALSGWGTPAMVEAMQSVFTAMETPTLNTFDQLRILTNSCEMSPKILTSVQALKSESSRISKRLNELLT